MRTCLLIILLVAPWCSRAWAQELDEGPEEPSPLSRSARVKFTFVPGLWLPRLSGDAKLGGMTFSRSIDLEDELSLRGQESTFRAELGVRVDDRWYLYFNGFDFSVEDDGTFAGVADFGSLPLRPGDTFDARLDMTSVGGEVAYWFGKPGFDDGETSLRFSPVLGLTYADVDQRVELVGTGTERTGGDWTGVMVGLRFDIEWEPPQVTLGGDGGSVWQLRAFANVDFTAHVGFQFGFRLLSLDVENDDYEFDGSLQGLFLAATLRF
jgi:hypothetical protein